MEYGGWNAEYEGWNAEYEGWNAEYGTIVIHEVMLLYRGKIKQT
jgi:hypothetical protein